MKNLLTIIAAAFLVLAVPLTAAQDTQPLTGELSSIVILPGETVSQDFTVIGDPLYGAFVSLLSGTYEIIGKDGITPIWVSSVPLSAGRLALVEHCTSGTDICPVDWLTEVVDNPAFGTLTECGGSYVTAQSSVPDLNGKPSEIYSTIIANNGDTCNGAVLVPEIAPNHGSPAGNTDWWTVYFVSEA